MQFRFSHVMIGITTFCVLLGLVLPSPPILSFPVLYVLMTATPAICLTGVVWGQGRQRAFYCGAMISGVAPWISAFRMTYETFPRIFYSLFIGNLEKEWFQPSIGSDFWTIHLLLLAPCFAALIGGVAGLIAYGFVVATNRTTPE